MFFSVYGTKWWTDNLKSRQVERALTKFKGCEPSCRKVQTVAALVGSGGVAIYIYIYVYIYIYSVYTYKSVCIYIHNVYISISLYIYIYIRCVFIYI